MAERGVPRLMVVEDQPAERRGGAERRSGIERRTGEERRGKPRSVPEGVAASEFVTPWQIVEPVRELG